MNRVLVTGGADTVGAAVVRRLLSDEVFASDQREAPVWMREGREVHRGDLRVLAEARSALYTAVFRAALDEDLTPFAYEGSSMGLRARQRVPDAPVAPLRLPVAAVGLRLLQAHGRGLPPRRPRGARPAAHDLPPFNPHGPRAARVGVRDGIARTAEWMRETPQAAAA